MRIFGAAGENLVRFAGVVSGGAHQTQRGGLGAVMGSKNVKALVITNPRFPGISAPEVISEMVGLYYEMAGWDKDGQPTAATLYDLNLENLVAREK